MNKKINILVVPVMAILLAGCTMPWSAAPATNTDTMDTQLEGSLDQGTDTPMMGDESGISEEGDAKITPSVEVSMLALDFEYDYKEIRARVGDVVTIKVTNSGKMPHDMVVDELGIKSEMLQPGGSTVVQFTPDKPGTYEYYCSVGNHRAQGMVGKLIIE
jgi:plastocyanin